MNFKKIKPLGAMVFLWLGLTAPLIQANGASKAMANEDLQRAINELAAAKVFVEKARMQEPAHERVVFHYDWLLSDINKVQGGIQQKFLMPRIQPRHIVSLKGDYLAVVGEGRP